VFRQKDIAAQGRNDYESRSSIGRKEILVRPFEGSLVEDLLRTSNLIWGRTDLKREEVRGPQPDGKRPASCLRNANHSVDKGRAGQKQEKCFTIWCR